MVLLGVLLSLEEKERKRERKKKKLERKMENSQGSHPPPTGLLC